MKSKSLGGKTTASIRDNISKYARTPLGLVNEAFVYDVALRDGRQVSTNCDEYAQENWITYYLILNTWMFQVQEVSERGRLELCEAIEKKGLLAVIAECDGVANRFIANMGDAEVDLGIPEYLLHLLTASENDRQCLQLLRYPKRFSPARADLIQKESISQLLRVNNRCMLVNRSGFEGWSSHFDDHHSKTPSRYWVDRIRDRIASILDGYNPDLADGIFSTGYAADAMRPLAYKLEAYSSWDCSLYQDPMYPISHGFNRVLWETSPFNSNFFSAKIVPVPKSYKTARVIAEEHAYRQYGMQAIRREIEKCIKRNGYEDYLDLHSQVRNQDYAKVGAIHGCYATIDLSSASDSIARTLAYEVLPMQLTLDVDRFLPRTFTVQNKGRRTMHMFCTSGSAVTFPVESLIFLAIAMEVREVVTALTGEFYLPPCVFGDDIVTDTLLYDTTIDVLEQLGFVVNTTKSYGPGAQYRESCGCEYVCGYDLQSVYWPRATFEWTSRHIAETLAQLTALQHKLYGTYMCRKFLAQFIRRLEPRMTSHIPGTECVDLWETIPHYIPVKAPGLDACEDARAMRERHLTLKTRWRGKVSERQLSGYTYPELVKMWRYSTFLKQGPRYDSELHRLLGVSSKPEPVLHDCVQGEMYWGYITE